MLQSLNASSRAMLMQKLDRTGTATRYAFILSLFFFIVIVSVKSTCTCCSIVGSLGAPLVNGAAPVQPPVISIPGQTALPTSAVPVVPVQAAEPIGIPSECLLLKNMFDPSTEVCVVYLAFLFLFSVRSDT